MDEKIEKLKSIAKEAGEIIKDGFFAKKSVRYKGLVDLVTEYDVATENFVKKRLAKEFKEYEIVAEESFIKKGENNKVIYLDPIDGTTNFVHSLPHVAISIAIWENKQPVYSVVYNPILDEMFWAVKGKGAFLNEKKLEVSKEKDLQRSLVATGFPYSKVEKGVEYRWVLESLANLLPLVQDIRRLGAASLDIYYCAQGIFEGYYEIDLKPWDVAAGILILQESGGKVSDIYGDDYSFDKKSIVCSNGFIHDKLIDNLAKI